MTEEAAPVTEQDDALFNIEKIYIKDLSLEVPHSPGIFLEHEQPRIDLQLSTHATGVDNGVYEVAITVTATARLEQKDIVAFLIEVKQAGVFVVRNMPKEELEQVLSIVCPNILYPFLRETVSDMSVRAGFQPVLLNPVNFEAMYYQKQQQVAEAAV